MGKISSAEQTVLYTIKPPSCPLDAKGLLSCNWLRRGPINSLDGHLPCGSQRQTFERVQRSTHSTGIQRRTELIRNNRSAVFSSSLRITRSRISPSSSSSLRNVPASKPQLRDGVHFCPSTSTTTFAMLDSVTSPCSFQKIRSSQLGQSPRGCS